jgi:hypothetical protein
VVPDISIPLSGNTSGILQFENLPANSQSIQFKVNQTAAFATQDMPSNIQPTGKFIEEYRREECSSPEACLEEPNAVGDQPEEISQPGNSYASEDNQEQEAANTAVQFTGMYDNRWGLDRNEAEEGSDRDKLEYGYYSPHIFDYPAPSDFKASTEDQDAGVDIEVEMGGESLFPGIDVESSAGSDEVCRAPDGWEPIITARRAFCAEMLRRYVDGELGPPEIQGNLAPRASEIHANIDEALIIAGPRLRTRPPRR